MQGVRRHQVRLLSKSLKQGAGTAVSLEKKAFYIRDHSDSYHIIYSNIYIYYYKLYSSCFVL